MRIGIDSRLPYYEKGGISQYERHLIAEAVDERDHILADSHHKRNDLIKNLCVPAHKVTTIHLAGNPIYLIPSLPEIMEATQLKFRLPKGFILFVGTISPRKNLQTLFFAYELLIREAKIDNPLVIVGRQGQMIGQGLIQAEKFAWEKTAQKTLSAYQTVNGYG